MSFQLFIGGIGGPELVIVLFLVVLLFGANKLPKLARASGEAMGEFQKGREQIESEIRDATRTTTAVDADADAATDVEEAVDADAATDVDEAVDVDTDAAFDGAAATVLEVDVDPDGEVERDRAPSA